MFAFAASGNAQSMLNAYYPQWGIYPGYLYYPKNLVSNSTAPLVTNLIYAFASVQNGHCAIGDSWADYQYPYTAANSIDGNADTNAPGALQGNFHQLQLLKQRYPNLKVLMSIGGSASPIALWQTSAQLANRHSFVASCVDMFINGNFASGLHYPGLFDGLDIDWEFPGATDTANFTALMSEFRSQLDAVKPGLTLTMASPAGSSDYRNIALSAVSQSLSFFNLMAYAYEGPWNTVTGFLAPLYHATGDPYSATIDATVHDYLAAGVPNSKILMGMYFYGYNWTNVAPAQQGLFEPGSPVTSGNYSYAYITGLPNYQSYRDPTTQAPWRFNGSSFWTYEDATSLSFKVSYLKNLGLAGAMVWDVAGDTADGSLLKTVSTALGANPDSAVYNFESGNQSWTSSGAAITSALSTTQRAFAGSHSLAVTFSGSIFSSTSKVYVSSPTFSPGNTVLFHIWIPANAHLTAVNPFVEDHAYNWTDDWQSTTVLVPNAWNTFSITIPANVALPLSRAGFEFTSDAAWSGTLYIDSIGTGADTALYNFESGIGSWLSNGSISSLSSSNSVVFAGSHALAVTFSSSSYTSQSQVYLASPSLQPGATVQFHIWVPANSRLSAVNPFVEDHNWNWSDNWHDISDFTPNAWNNLYVTIPASIALPLSRIGIEFTSAAPWSGTCYIDSISP